MATAKLSDMMSRLGRGLPTGAPAETEPDGDLLARFLATRDEHAFAMIVRRHGPMVLGVCRRLIGGHHLAEDAFQAVFVVLAAKAGSVRPRAALPAWLYGVAYRTALRARTMSDRRLRREATVETLPEPAEFLPDPVETADTVEVLDEEIARLPAHLQEAVVQCELQGRSRQEAARSLGVAEGTLSSRLAAARKALAARLRRRGIALSAAGLTAALGQSASASVPADLSAKTVAAALDPHFVPAPVAALSQGVMRIMLAQKLKAVPVAVLLAAAVVLAGGLLLAGDGPPAPLPAKPSLAFVEVPKTAAPAERERKGSIRLLIWRKGQLVLMDADGKNEKALTGSEPERTKANDKLFVHSGKLSPDGKRLAIVYQVGDIVPAPIGGATIPPRRGLYVRDIYETGPGTDLGVDCQTFCWSPDGTEIAYSQFEDQPGNVTASHGVVNVKTKKKTALPLLNDHVITDWSRDERLFLTCDPKNMREEEPRSRMYLMNRDGTVHKALGDPKQVAVLGRLSPDGTRVLFLRVIPPKEETREEIKTREALRIPSPQATHKLAVLEVASGKAALVADMPLDGELHSACWSPDGKKIAYTWREVHAGDPKEAATKETESFLVLSDPDGKNQKTIATEKGLGQWHTTLDDVDWGFVIDDEKKEKSDAEKIIGVWKPESVIDGGNDRDTQGSRMVFTGNKVTITDDKKDVPGEYKLDPSKKPKWIDITVDGRTMPGIYEMDGDKLRICLNEIGEGERPTAFESKGGSSPNDLLMVLERDKK